MDIFKYTADEILKMEQEGREFSIRIQKEMKESRAMMVEKRKRFEENRKRRAKHFDFLNQ